MVNKLTILLFYLLTILSLNISLVSSYDVYTIIKDPSNSANYLALAADAGGAIIPGVTGLGIAVRTAKAGDKALGLATKADDLANGVQGVNKLTDAANAEKAAQAGGNAAKTENKIGNVEYSSLTPEAQSAVDKIDAGKGGELRPHPFENRAGDLPMQPDPNYYTAYDTALGKTNDQRIVTGKSGEQYYTDKHYQKGSLNRIIDKFKNYFGGRKNK